MITLITASPGGAKTLTTVGIHMQQAIKEGRAVFTAGIPDLSLPHFPVPPMAEWTELRDSEEEPGLKLPYFTFPAGSLIVLDECQRYFRKRPSGSKVPDAVAAFETHRHTGVDFILITQHPSKIDPEVLAVVGKHVHLRDVGLFGRWMYEWNEYTDPRNFKNAPVKKRFQLPREAFDLYTSSTKHIKPVKTVPPALKLIALAALAGLYFSYSFYQRHFADLAPASDPVASAAPASAHPSPSGTPQSSDSATKTGAVVLEDFIPPHPMHPELAPAYASKLAIQQVPQITACAAVQNGPCYCYTQQGTKVDVPPTMCRDWIKSPPFNPYRELARSEPASAPPHADQNQRRDESATAPNTRPTAADSQERSDASSGGKGPPALASAL